MDVNIRIAGEAGQGLQTAGDLLVEAFASIGLHLLSTQSYMSRIRGGLNWYDIRIADQELFASREDVDLLVALSEDALTELRSVVNPAGLIVYDGEAEGAITLHFDDVAKEVGGNAVMANAVAAGAVFGLLGYDVEKLVDYLGLVFKSKSAEIILANSECARRGQQLMAGQAGKIVGPTPADGTQYVVDGASAMGLGACTAGIKFVAAYPMSPSTAVLNFMASMTEQYGVLVEQAEDEISAMNMICGASYAGAPAMTTTSGGGFSLMVEGLSLAGMLEVPVVILLGMRPGPATGLPTRTGQEDLKVAINAGHGEFPRAVFAPGGMQETYDCARQAVAIAHKYQVPAFVLMDQYLIDMHKNTAPLDREYRPVDRHVVEAGSDYIRYALTDSGVSPRAIPGGEAFVVVDSDEHTADGHITERLDVRVQMVDKRLRKEQGLRAEMLPPVRYGPGDAETLLVCWGSTYGPAREAVDWLNREGGRYALLHFPQVWPLDAKVVREAIGSPQRLICVEGNALGQFAAVLRQIGAVQEIESVTRYDGLPFVAAGLVRRLRDE